MPGEAHAVSTRHDRTGFAWLSPSYGITTERSWVRVRAAPSEIGAAAAHLPIAVAGRLRAPGAANFPGDLLGRFAACGRGRRVFVGGFGGGGLGRVWRCLAHNPDMDRRRARPVCEFPERGRASRRLCGAPI